MQREIIEGNKLIAEFMGAELSKYSECYVMKYMQDLPHYRPENMKYHSSWDWIMPVAHKIRQDHDYQVDILGSKPIGAWYDCVDFIEWHNATCKQN
jgi:hypothetical protein